MVNAFFTGFHLRRSWKGGNRDISSMSCPASYSCRSSYAMVNMIWNSTQVNLGLCEQSAISLPCLEVDLPHRKVKVFTSPICLPCLASVSNISGNPSFSEFHVKNPAATPLISKQSDPDSLSLPHVQVTFAGKQSSWGTQPCGLPHDVISLPLDKPEKAKNSKFRLAWGK